MRPGALPILMLNRRSSSPRTSTRSKELYQLKTPEVHCDGNEGKVWGNRPSTIFYGLEQMTQDIALEENPIILIHPLFFSKTLLGIWLCLFYTLIVELYTTSQKSPGHNQNTITYQILVLPIFFMSLNKESI